MKRVSKTPIGSIRFDLVLVFPSRHLCEIINSRLFNYLFGGKMSEAQLDKNQALSVLIAFINQGQIELPCLKEFNKFRDWELSQSRPDDAKFNQLWDYDLAKHRNDICRQAAALDAEYLTTFLEVLMSERTPRERSVDAWNLTNDLRVIRDKIEANSLEPIQK